MLQKGILWLLGMMIYAVVKAQTIDTCEYRFLKNNLLLIAEEFNIDISRAAVLQAKIWDLPYLSAELNAYNPGSQRALDIGDRGQKALALQQIICLGNKRHYEVGMRMTNFEMAELQFEDLMRNLRRELRMNFYTIYFEKKKLAFTDTTIANLDTLIHEYKTQVQKGNLPMKDLIRLQSMFFNMKSERNILVNSIFETQQKLKLICGMEQDIVPVVDLRRLTFSRNTISYSSDSLSEIAIANRPDFLLAKKQVESYKWQLEWQKALAVPDVTIGLSYDQRGGAFNNQVNLVLGIPLPLWNRNKGNILMAENQLRQVEYGEILAGAQIRNEVSANYAKWKEAYNNYQDYEHYDEGSFNEVYQGVIRNFRKRNITIMEFTDFMESYNTSMQQFNEIRKRMMIAGEDLNSTINLQLF